MTCNHQNYRRISEFDSVFLYECENCKLIFTDRYGKAFDYKVLYADYYKNELATRFGFGVEYLIRIFRFFRAFKVFTIAYFSKSILDVGSGRGYMLFYLKKYFKYYRTAGTQISKNAFNFSRNKLGLEIYDKDLLELNLNNAQFDVITVWHVLEHVPSPEKYIERISYFLKQKGKLIIEVPNYNSWTRVLTGKYWLGMDLDYHITFFRPESLSFLLKSCNFKIKNIHTFSLEYSTFLSAQSLISKFTQSNHVLFNHLQEHDLKPQLLIQILFFILLAPVCFLINILLYFSKKGEVLFVIAEKI